MKCLAVQQPWAWAICAGFKRIENRTWKTPYRGTVAIVASGKKTAGMKAFRDFPGLRLPVSTLVYGAVIGTVELTDVVPLSAAVEDDSHAFGPFCWVFEKARMFEMPIPTTAKLRLYDPAPDDAAKIAKETADPPMDLTNPVYAEFARSLVEDPYSRGLAHGDYYWQNDAWPDLSRVAARLIALDPARPEGYLFRAEVGFHTERDAEAMADYNRAIGINPKLGLAYLGRSHLHAAMGNKDAADFDYATAVRLDPFLAQDGGPGGGDDDAEE